MKAGVPDVILIDGDQILNRTESILTRIYQVLTPG